MAGTDCGFGGRSHPQIAWAKPRLAATPPESREAMIEFYSREIEALVRAHAPGMPDDEVEERQLRGQIGHA
jgi:hypothetical protein